MIPVFKEHTVHWRRHMHANNFNIHIHTSIIEVKIKLYGNIEEGRIEFY